MQYDLVIIGAGMSGLAAGIRAAYYGQKVCIVEKHSVWGGLNSFYKKGGYHFDVGLHALTNWRQGKERNPLQRIYRQLRIQPEEFALEPQGYSKVIFEGAELEFSNGLERLRQQIQEKFPTQTKAFFELEQRCKAYPDGGRQTPFVSARRELEALFSEPLLVDMLLCPLLFYGSSVQNDIDFEQFIILFNSIYREGFCRPRRGVRQILDVLRKRYLSLGGTFRFRSGVNELTVCGSSVQSLVLESGECLHAHKILSSAGLVETMALRSDCVSNPSQKHQGKLAFVETIWVLDTAPKDLGWTASIAFYNNGNRFSWERPKDPVDLRSGVICCPGNFEHQDPPTPHVLRATHIADYVFWFGCDSDTYKKRKTEWAERSLEAVGSHVGDFRANILYQDCFTPKTVHRFTSHLNGAVYGAEKKQKDGRTELTNLFLCGTDQGFVGIVGTMLSGIVMVNQHVL